MLVVVLQELLVDASYVQFFQAACREAVEWTSFGRQPSFLDLSLAEGFIGKVSLDFRIHGEDLASYGCLG